MIVRALAPDDRMAVRALVEREFTGTRYVARLLEQVELAIDARDAEYGGVVAEEHAVLGVMLLGEIAGANGALKIHALVGEHHDALEALLAAKQSDLHAARIALCELPDETAFKHAADALSARGFVEESRAEQLVAGDVALRFFVRRSAR